jgi:hypothetical protein
MATEEPNITMWGASGSGKTAFLAALQTALIQTSTDWNLTGADLASTEQLNEMTEIFCDNRRFPDATDAMTYYNWNLQRLVHTPQSPPPPPPAPQRRSFGRRQPPPPPFTPPPSPQPPRVERIRLRLLDLPGGEFNQVTEGKLIDNLADSQGILFLYDPVSEYRTGNAYRHLYKVLNLLAFKMISEDEVRLPHRIAVCMTKFDHPKVLETARSKRLLDLDPADERRPLVSPQQARQLFMTLCTIARNANVTQILPTLEKYFYSDRIRFFATSAVGVYTDPDVQRFSFEDSQNIVVDRQGTPTIRGVLRPMNVIEPVLWLGEALEETRP